MDNKQIQFVRIVNFDDAANKVMNRAMQHAASEYCGVFNSVHIFLAFIEKTKIGDDILKYFETSFDMFYESYQLMVSDGEFGKIDENDLSHIYNFDLTSKELYSVLAALTTSSALKGKQVTETTLFNAILDAKEDCLLRYLDNIGLSIDDIREFKTQRFDIPEQLKSFVVDMNSEDKKNAEVLDNTKEYTDEMIEVLSRKLEANPCLVGEAGVGKTTLVRALVQRIVSGDVPESLKNTHIIYINSSLLTSGTMYRGMFEERMQKLFEWASNSNIILFLDEIHTFINLGGGGNEASTAGNMIKKYLSDGDIKIIGATTLKEYHKYIESDSAFNRRLQSIDVKEPSVEVAKTMLKNTISTYEEFHKVKVSEESLNLAVELSDRYMKDKFLPAKAYKVIDQAATSVKLAGKEEVLPENIFATVSKITGIDVNKLSKSELKQLLNLEKALNSKLIGQEEAVKTVSKAIRRSKAGVREENKPVASFLFVGPTGVGKTELCKLLSKEVAVGDASLIKVDMSEYSEKHSISKMIGTAPGYIGYGEGGNLTEKVKHNPYSIILFDEIEKAHPEVFNVFLQLLDEGRMTDGEGTTVDFTNCIIVMTSNAGYGAEKLYGGRIGFTELNDNTVDAEKIAMNALKSTFKPEFLNRLDNIVVFNKLTKEQSKSITKLSLDKLSARVLKSNNITIKFNKSVIDNIAEAGFSDEYGARNINREIQNRLEDNIADAILSVEIKSGDTASVSIKNNNVIIKKVEEDK